VRTAITCGTGPEPGDVGKVRVGMSHPFHLAHGASADELDSVVVTPESAGWAFCGLRIVELAPGGTRVVRTGPDEMLVLPLAGSARVECQGHSFELAGRRNVFDGPSDFAYLPLDSEATISSVLGGRFALPAARATHSLPAAYGPAAAIPVELRGAGSSSRQLHNFCDPVSFAADKLIAVECITPAGNWSSWPPHKHDSAGPGEAELEEIYYFEVSPADTEPRRVGEGFALFRLYTTGHDIDLCEEVGQGDVVLVPRGYHGPSVAAPGYDLYHLNVLAGPAADRTMAFCDDPEHQWIRQTWTRMDADARLPMGQGRSAAGGGSAG
jgi:5-deoxy-glucuronate isomerase